ncbi:syntaphilin [Gouania willdenowi]|uniref:Syntaphilin-like n=1 Tax=Gouania willdenowi TaxID=441366 RepID=A0A8C5G8W9_GOUWI|nr:syntaphilin-like [Gouania willdenowi]XP_028309952.1 syntaphilin-like [Gouania willdenowi]
MSRKPSSGQRRCSGGTGSGIGKHSHSESSSTYTYHHQGRIRAPEGSPTAQTYPTTPRRQVKHTTCSDNHGVRPPTPEQYLTPLQQKEVCIRHLRARLRENVERLHHRDYEIDELRTQLYRMQEDWIEEECHRVEAQLALKEARKEIRQLQEVVESVKSNLEVPDPHHQNPFSGPQGPPPCGRSRSCGCSPASTLSRGTTHARLSHEALQLEQGGVPHTLGQSHLLLEAASLSEQLHGHLRGPHPSVPRSSTHERLCRGGAVLPLSHSCHTLSSGCRCSGHALLPHHHLFLHLPQEEPPINTPTITPTPTPAAESIPIPPPSAVKKTEVCSRASSPTMSWLCEEGATDQLSVISVGPALQTSSSFVPLKLSPRSEPLPTDRHVPIAAAEPQTCQPQPAAPLPVRQEAPPVVGQDRPEDAEETNESPSQCRHWSRYFLVDLLALAVPVVPTVAWLCRGTSHDVVPVYHIGSLLRGCCAVALHSLRRQGGMRGRPTSTNGTI